MTLLSSTLTEFSMFYLSTLIQSHGSGLNLSDNQIEERGVYHILRHLVSPSDKECALISLHLDGNPGCDANVEEVLHSMNDMTAESPLFASLRPDVAAVLRKWLVVKKGKSR